MRCVGAVARVQRVRWARHGQKRSEVKGAVGWQLLHAAAWPISGMYVHMPQESAMPHGFGLNLDRYRIPDWNLYVDPTLLVTRLTI